MNFQTVMLLACLLCAESPAGTLLEKFLIAQTVVYRAEVSGMSVKEVIYAPFQYPGVHAIDLEGYRLYRPQELEENIHIAMWVLFNLPVVKVSHFARTGTCWYDRPCEWESQCKLLIVEGKHSFYLCPDWEDDEMP